MGRAPCCDKAYVKKGPWAPEEDAMLKAYIEENGTGGNWIALPHKIGLKRCGKSCRLRWLNYLRPNLKHGGFSEEEDRIICSLYISIGSRWSIIAAQLPGRTDNDIKNYWNTRLKKKLLGKRRESSQSRHLPANNRPKEEANGMNQDTSSPTLSESAMERMQLHMQLQGLSSPCSFYNNPALWPKSHLLCQKSDAISASPWQQAPEGTKSDQPITQEPAFLVNSDVAVSATTQEDMDSSTLGLPSPSSAGTILNAENQNLSFDSVYAAGFPTELHDYLYDRNATFGLQGEHQILKLDCYKGTYSEKDGMTWWPSSSFEYERSSASSWEYSSVFQSDSLVQEYPVPFDL